MDISELVERLRQRVVPSGSTLERAVKGGMWEGGINSLNRVIQLVKIAILANLLPPKEFGILGIGFLTLAVFESFSQLGIDAALIQRKEEKVDKYLNTAWVLHIARGLLLTGTIFVVAPYLASWFGEPRATNVIRALGIGPLLLGLKNPGVVYFQKNLQFHLRFAQIMSGTTVNFVVTVCLGILLGNVWALVGGTIAGNVTSFFISYILYDYRPSFDLDPDLARELMDFGKWIFGNSIARFLQNQGDDIFVGWLLGATPLAFYQMAYRFSNAPATELTSVINKVTFPSLSQVQDNTQKLRSGYFRTLRFNAFLVLPATAGIALVAPSFVRTVLGTDWIPVVPVLQVLAIWGGIRAVVGSNGPVFLTLSRPDIGFKLTLVRVCLIAVAIYPAATRFGLVGVAGTLIGAGLVVAPISVVLALQLINASARRYVGCLVHPLIGSGVMAAVLFALGEVLPINSAPLELVLFVTTGTVTYFLYIYIATAVFKYRIRDDLRPILQLFRG